MNIYCAHTLPNTIPEGFDAICISLDAGVRSLLEWKKELNTALEWKEKGIKLFWSLDFGLFHMPNDSVAALEILRLAVEHFKREVWEIFQDASVGVCLYEGSCALEGEQVEFLEQLAACLPDGANPFLLLDVSTLSSSIEIAHSLSKERFPHFTLAVKGTSLPLSEYGWETAAGEMGFIGAHLLTHTRCGATVGICVPQEGEAKDLEAVIEELQKRSVPFRMIPEALLTGEWQGLDAIIVDSNLTTPLTVRKLMGFCAAGGTIATLGEPLHLPHEVSVEKWIGEEAVLSLMDQ